MEEVTNVSHMTDQSVLHPHPWTPAGACGGYEQHLPLASGKSCSRCFAAWFEALWYNAISV